MTEQKNRTLRSALLLAGVSMTLVGCGVGNQAAAEGASENGIVARVDAPLRAPAWAEDEGVVIALQEDGRRLVRLDPGESFDGTRNFLVTTSQELDGSAGENLRLESGRMPDEIYLPKPERDQVTVVENDDLLEVRNFVAGDSPARIALGGSSTGYGTQTLFALSEDGQTVTVAELETPGAVAARAEVGASEDSLIEASGEEGFWMAGPEGVALYGGIPPERLGNLPLEAGTFATDADDPLRAYVGETSSGRVVAIEPDEAGELRIVAEVTLTAPAEYLDAEDGRLYAVTRDELVVLDSETLETVETVELGPLVAQENLEQAEHSGLTVGEENVYVTLKGEPYVLLIGKP